MFVKLLHGVLGASDGDALGSRVRIDLVVVASGFRPVAKKDDPPEIALQETQAVSLVPALTFRLQFWGTNAQL